jgi:hypothetical protein
MFYHLSGTDQNGTAKPYAINTALIAYYSTGEEGPSGPLDVEIVFSGGAILKFTTDQMNWNHFLSVVDRDHELQVS